MVEGGPPRLLRLPLLERPGVLVRALGAAAGGALILATAALQPHLYPDLPVAVLYVVPVVLVAWTSGMWPAFAAALTASAARMLVDTSAGVVPSAPSVPYWNFAISSALYIALAALLSQMHRTLLYERELARTDPLTQLGNRRFFERVAGVELSRSRRYGRAFALAYVDIDHFKEVNDRLGHAEGDQLLQRTAGLLVEALRTSDVVARLGGDEFALLLPETAAEGAAVAMQKVHERLGEEMRSAGYAVSFSIGVVCYTDGAATLAQLLDAADRMMYEVKRDGRDAVRVGGLDAHGTASAEPLHSA